jgi:hypothetical protein
MTAPWIHRCFLGDNRGPDSNISASFRTLQRLIFGVPSLAVSKENNFAGVSQEVDCQHRGTLIGKPARADVTQNRQGPISSTMQGSHKVLEIPFFTRASDPLIQWPLNQLTPPAFAQLTVFLDLSVCKIWAEGLATRYPSFEAYATAGKSTVQILNLEALDRPGDILFDDQTIDTSQNPRHPKGGSHSASGRCER